MKDRNRRVTTEELIHSRRALDIVQQQRNAQMAKRGAKDARKSFKKFRDEVRQIGKR